MKRLSFPIVFASLIALASMSTGCSQAASGDASSVNATPTATATTTSDLAMTLSPASQSAVVNTQIIILASGGTAPYTYSTSNGGTFDGSTFTAPSTAQTLTLSVTDALGAVTSETLTITANSTSVPFGTVQSNEILSGWSVDGLIVPGSASVYSSNGFLSQSNDRGVEVAAWFATGPQTISSLTLTARMWNGTALGFPSAYNVYVTASDNSSWILVGSFSNQPDSTGVATISFGTSYQTYGVEIVPTTLGVDDNGQYYFQLVGMSAQTTL